MRVPNQSRGVNRSKYIFVDVTQATGMMPSQSRSGQRLGSTTGSVPIEWGCGQSGDISCGCQGGKNSAQCQIIAPNCADDLICLGDDCFCTWNGGPFNIVDPLSGRTNR